MLSSGPVSRVPLPTLSPTEVVPALCPPVVVPAPCSPVVHEPGPGLEGAPAQLHLRPPVSGRRPLRLLAERPPRLGARVGVVVVGVVVVDVAMTAVVGVVAGIVCRRTRPGTGLTRRS